MLGVALSFAVLDATGSVSDLGFVFAARSIPLVGFLLAGGVVADRLSRRTVMVAADVVRLVSQGIVAALLISGHVQLWELIVLQAVHGIANMLAAAFFVLGAAISKSSLGGPTAWALILASFGVGSFGGGLLALRLHPRRPFFASFVGYLPFGLPNVLLALHAPVVGIAAAACVAGGGLMIGNALWETTLQQQVPAASLSRVTAYDWFGSLAFAPLGNVLVGPVAVAIGTRPTLWCAGLGIIVLDLLVLSTPAIRQVTRR